MEDKAKDRAKDVAKDIKGAGSEPEDPVHFPGTRKGEEMKKEEHSGSGRKDMGTSGAGRPAGTSNASDSTSINPSAEEPIDPDSPPLRTP
ncbi:MAG: hypothetical protein ABR525_03795 [Candidatus Limnocylindria bacterium]